MIFKWALVSKKEMRPVGLKFEELFVW